MAPQCSICLSAFEDPVCTPCGHVYCLKCLADHVNNPRNEDLNSSCPTCRRQFTTVMPDLTYLPKKYHQYVIPSVRRVYFDNTSEKVLRRKLEQADLRVVDLQNKNELLVAQCKQYVTAVQAHSSGEQEARLRVSCLEDKVNHIQKKAREESKSLLKDINKVIRERDALKEQGDALEQRMKTLTVEFEALNAKLERRSTAAGISSVTPTKRHHRPSSSVHVPSPGPPAAVVKSPAEKILNRSRSRSHVLPVDSETKLYSESLSFDMFLRNLDRAQQRVNAADAAAAAVATTTPLGYSRAHREDATNTTTTTITTTSDITLNNSRQIKPLPRLRRTREEQEQFVTVPPPHFGKRPRHSAPGGSGTGLLLL